MAPRLALLALAMAFGLSVAFAAVTTVRQVTSHATHGVAFGHG
jgi:hypothetical protein